MRAGLPVALALLLAGCTGGSPPLANEAPAPEALQAPAVPAGSAGPPANATLPPIDIVVYLTPEHGLSRTPPAEGTVPDTAGFGDPGFLVSTAGFPYWKLDTHLGRDQRIVAGTVEVVFSSAGPQVDGGSPFGFGPVIFWHGEEGRHSPSHNLDGPAVLAPGEVARIQGALLLPPGGMVFEEGAVPAVLLAFTYTQDSANPILVHTGPNGTRLKLTIEGYEPAEHRAKEDRAFDGSFTYNTFFAPAPDTEDNTRTFPLQLDATPAKLEARLTGTTSALAQDLDLALLDPRGEAVWASTSPLPTEGLVLYDVNFPAGPGAYALRVTNFQTVQGTFALAVTVHT